MVYHMVVYQNTPAKLIHDKVQTKDYELFCVVYNHYTDRGFIVDYKIES